MVGSQLYKHLLKPGFRRLIANSAKFLNYISNELSGKLLGAQKISIYI